MVVELEMAPVRHAVHILPDLMIAARSTEPSSPDPFAPLDQRLGTMVSDLLFVEAALCAARASTG